MKEWGGIDLGSEFICDENFEISARLRTSEDSGGCGMSGN